MSQPLFAASGSQECLTLLREVTMIKKRRSEDRPKGEDNLTATRTAFATRDAFKFRKPRSKKPFTHIQ
jgi:hypothetical protein